MTRAAPLPELPRLAPWYRLVEGEESLVLEHGGRAVVLEGAAVARLLPALLPLLDGTRTVAEVASTLGAGAAPAVEHALRVLHERRLLVDGPPPERDGEPRAAADQLAAAGGADPAAVARRLATATAAVVGAATTAAEVARLLRRAGVDSVPLRGWESREPADLVVAAPSPAELGELERWNVAALEQGRAWLQLLPFDGRLLAVGPLFVPGATACAACYRLRRAATLGFGVLAPALEQSPVAAAAGPALAAAGAAVAAEHALRWLALGDPRLPGVLYALDDADGGLRLSAHLVLRVPRCPACSGADTRARALPWHEAAAR